MPVDGTASDIKIADDELVASPGSKFVEVLLYGIDRKTVADREHFERLSREDGGCGEKEKQ